MLRSSTSPATSASSATCSLESGPAPVVCFVVAADEGWQAQSSDHRDAVAALGIEHGVMVLSRADRASGQRIADVLARTRSRAGRDWAARMPPQSPCPPSTVPDWQSCVPPSTASWPTCLHPPPIGRVRLWVDRSFTITGSGTVVTGTLAAGTIVQGDRLELAGPRWFPARRRPWPAKPRYLVHLGGARQPGGIESA